MLLKKLAGKKATQKTLGHKVAPVPVLKPVALIASYMNCIAGKDWVTYLVIEGQS